MSANKILAAATGQSCCYNLLTNVTAI